MVIAHPDVTVNTMTSNHIKQIYLNRSKKWQDGSRIHLTILSNHPSTTLFMEKYLGKRNTQFDRYWKRQLFSGKGIPPEYFKTLEDLLHYIHTTKGAIGIIDCNTPPAGVSVILLVE